MKAKNIILGEVHYSKNIGGGVIPFTPKFEVADNPGFYSDGVFGIRHYKDLQRTPALAKRIIKYPSVIY